MDIGLGSRRDQALVLRLSIEPYDPPAKRLVEQAVQALHRGAIAAYATDSMYALGCALDARKSATELYAIKGMEKSQRLALICPDLSTAAVYGHFSQAAFKLGQRIFPGPFTMVVPASREVPRLLTDKKRRMVGIRVVDHPVVAAMVKALGQPLLTTSAIGPKGELCVDADDVAELFGHRLDLLIDSGPTPGAFSTVVKVESETIEIVRPGLGVIE